MLLKSGEDVISDAKEIMDTEKKGIVAYHLSNPFVMQLTAEESDELQVEGEEGPRTKYSVKYTHWAPLSKQRSFVIPAETSFKTTCKILNFTKVPLSINS